LANEGHEVTVYTTNVLSEKKLFKPKYGFHNIDGVNVHYFRNMLYEPHSRVPLFFSKDLIRAVKKNLANYDIIHIHEYRFYISLVVQYYAKKYGIPFVLQAHGSLPRVTSKQGLKWIFDTFFGHKLLRDASKVIALNGVEAKQYKSMGVSKEKIEVIPNGVDFSEYADFPSHGFFKNKFGIGYDKKIVLYVGRIHKSKGLDLLAYSFKIVSAEVDNARFVIIGPDDGYATEFNDLISDLGLEKRVIFTGFLDKNDKLAAFIDSEIFVTPKFSGFPVTFLESCLADCPIVTASNELKWIHNNVGYVTEYSPGALAKAIVTLLQDEQINRKFRNNCMKTIKDFDIMKVIQQLEKVYEAVAK
jgi:glycosyltransferase involved in cell wall biosynthesis